MDAGDANDLLVLTGNDRENTDAEEFDQNEVLHFEEGRTAVVSIPHGCCSSRDEVQSCDVDVDFRMLRLDVRLISLDPAVGESALEEVVTLVTLAEDDPYARKDVENQQELEHCVDNHRQIHCNVLLATSSDQKREEEVNVAKSAGHSNVAKQFELVHPVLA